MPTKSDMRWFKEQFGEKMKAELEGTPFSIDFMTALHARRREKFGPSWRKKNLTLDRIVELCVGDTIDFNPTTGKGRKAFPRNKAALVAVPNGQKMFDVARQALVDMAQFIPATKERRQSRTSSVTALASSNSTCSSSSQNPGK
jgi:hypothetical protein